MATMASAAGIQPEVARRMGRWKGEVSAQYVRIEKQLVMKAQAKIAGLLRSGGYLEVDVMQWTVV
eukprot:5074363-Amphidinium_carterae.1